jgi:hypothetical protein
MSKCIEPLYLGISADNPASSAIQSFSLEKRSIYLELDVEINCFLNITIGEKHLSFDRIIHLNIREFIVQKAEL